MRKKGTRKQILIYDWERSISLFAAWSIVNIWFTKKKEQKFFMMPGVIVSQNNLATGYLKSPQILIASRKLVGRFRDNRQFLISWQKDVRRHYYDLKRWCRRLQKVDLNGLSNIKLNYLYQHYFMLYTDLLNHVGVIRVFNQTATDFLESYLKKKIRNNIPEIIATLSSTTKKSFINQNRIALLKLALLRRQNKKVNKAIEEYLAKWQWVGVGFMDEPALSKKIIEKEVMKIARRDPRKDLEKINRQYSQLRYKKRAVLRSIPLSISVRNLIRVSEWATYFKDFIRSGHNYSHYYSQPLFREIGKRLDLTFRDVKMLLPSEVDRALKGESINYSVIKQRKRKYVIEVTSHEIKFYTGKKADWKERQIKSAIGDVKKLVGTVANPGGKIKGKVKIVRSSGDYKKGTGFILVSPMTMPDIALILKKAKAIITDEGGLTSHAAIISRELNIPCVIGTKIATKVFKDGDKVEVDATKGIVKKI